MLLVALPSGIVIFACAYYFWGQQWRTDALLRSGIKRILDVSQCQTLLTWVYPLYIFGFVSIRGINQALFVLVLPVIKLVGKNWISRLLGEHNDMKPEIVIFNVEIFHALYISSAIQRASSIPATATIMLVDLMHFWLTMTDVVELLNEVKVLMTKIPQAHPVASENFVQIALRLLIIKAQETLSGNISNEGRVRSRSLSSAKVSAEERQPSWASLTGIKDNDIQEEVKRSVGRRAQVFPIRPPSRHPLLQLKVQVNPKTRQSEMMAKMDTLSLGAIFSPAERLLFIRKTMRVLFVTEYLVLVEYTEAILPIIYSLNRVILVTLPNAAYYPSLSGLSHVELVSMILNVLVYGALEFTSLIVTVVVLKQVLGFSSWHQLAFVLDTQAAMVQTKLTVWFMYIMQISLIHLGADFSFKFAWVHKAFSNA